MICVSISVSIYGSLWPLSVRVWLQRGCCLPIAQNGVDWGESWAAGGRPLQAVCGAQCSIDAAYAWQGGYFANRTERAGGGWGAGGLGGAGAGAGVGP